jgi:alpha-glucosidase
LLSVAATDQKEYKIEIQPVYDYIVRVRFNPAQKCAYSAGNTRTVITDSVHDLKKLTGADQIRVVASDSAYNDSKAIVIDYTYSDSSSVKVVAYKDEFSLDVYKSHNDYTSCVLTGAKISFSPNKYDDFNIITTINKPATAKFVGFGEQVGRDLVKNSTRISYFNYDNMEYNQVYGKGPFEEREPLYHSDPFFMRVNVDHDKNVMGIFVDSASEVLMDIGACNAQEYRFGTRYDDMDFYIIIARYPADVIVNLSKIIGTARLIPRYALGYHQGCYGYEKRSDLEEAVNSYRSYNIPLDGLHVDVDLQEGYKTFTINENAFPNPTEMFSNLRKQGVKCSTNITPIISDKNADNYSTFQEGIKNGFFVKYNAQCQFKGSFEELERSDVNAAFCNSTNNTTYIKVFNSENARKDIVLKSGGNLVSQDELTGAVYRAIKRFASRDGREASLSLK